MAGWLSGSIRERIDEVTLRRAGLVRTEMGDRSRVFNQATQANAAWPSAEDRRNEYTGDGYAPPLG